MLSLFRSLIAICLILLAASPFNAPFATCDLSTPIDHRQPVGDHQAADGFLVKAPSNAQKEPVLAEPVTMSAPLFDFVPDPVAAAHDQVQRPLPSRPVLRI
jgi:hypothetical protein